MTSLKKYELLDINVVMIDQDIITTSQGGYGGGDPFEGAGYASKMNPLDRPLGIFKRD